MKNILFILIAFLAMGIATLMLIGKKHIATEIIIHAPAARVWDTLIDIDRYPEWNPFIRKAVGKMAEGQTIEVTFHTKGSDPITFTPTILVMKKHSLVEWEGRLLLPGIFTGRHTFELVPVSADTTRLIQKEDFNGILVPFFDYEPTIEGFTSMNNELKKRAERRR